MSETIIMPFDYLKEEKRLLRYRNIIVLIFKMPFLKIASSFRNMGNLNRHNKTAQESVI